MKKIFLTLIIFGGLFIYLQQDVFAQETNYKCVEMPSWFECQLDPKGSFDSLEKCKLNCHTSGSCTSLDGQTGTCTFDDGTGCGSKAYFPTGKCYSLYRCCGVAKSLPKSGESCSKGGKSGTCTAGCGLDPEIIGENLCEAGLMCCNPKEEEEKTTPPTAPPGGTTDSCGNPCPAGAVCFANPLSVCSVKGLVINVLQNLRGIVALIAIVVIVIGGIWYMASFGNEEAMKRAKMIIATAVGGLALILAAPSFIKEILRILQDKPIGPGDVSQALTIQQILLSVLQFLLASAGIIALISMVTGGIMYMTSGGDEDRMKTGKKIFVYAIIGIVITIGSLLIIKQVASFFGVR